MNLVQRIENFVRSVFDSIENERRVVHYGGPGALACRDFKEGEDIYLAYYAYEVNCKDCKRNLDNWAKQWRERKHL